MGTRTVRFASATVVALCVTMVGSLSIPAASAGSPAAQKKAPAPRPKCRFVVSRCIRSGAAIRRAAWPQWLHQRLVRAEFVPTCLMRRTRP